MGEISFDGLLVPLKNKSELIDEEINVNGRNNDKTSILVGFLMQLFLLMMKILMLVRERILKNMSFLNKVQM